MTKFTWTEEAKQALLNSIGDTTEVVSKETILQLAEDLKTTTKSVCAKLRTMGYQAESFAKESVKVFSEKEANELRNFVEDNPGKYTIPEIAVFLYNDEAKSRSIQGKLLSMNLLGLVKKMEPKVYAKLYTEEEQDLIEQMVSEGKYIEEIAEALDRDVKSVRGKCLAMTKSHGISIPKQKESVAKQNGDPIEALGDISAMTVEEIAEVTGKSIRGVKTILTLRKLTASNYDGAKKSEKNAQKRAKVEEVEEVA